MKSDATLIEPKQPDDGAGQDNADQRSGDSRTAALGENGDRNDADADRQRIEVCLRQLTHDLHGPTDQGTLRSADTQQRRQLADDDMHGNAGEKAGRHRNGKQVGDPTRTQQARNQ